MDVPRGKEVARKKLIRRIALITVILAAIPLITWGLSRLKPAAPSVDRATVWIDTVKRGPMLREVRGLGTLVVEEYNWIPAQFESRVEKLNFLPGAKLHPNDVIMIRKNHDDVVRMELGARQEVELLHAAFKLRGNPVVFFDHQCAEAAHFAQHGTAFDGVDPNRGPIHRGGGRLEARKAPCNQRNCRQDDGDERDSANQLLTCYFFTARDIHGVCSRT